MDRVRRIRACFAALGVAVVLVACEGKAVVTYSTAAAGAPAASWSFDQDPAGKPPAGAEVFAGEWAVRAEADAPSPPNALCQTGRAEFPAMALGSAVYGNVTITARFKPISGNEDRAAGIIARVQDKDNYYILRANALEGNVNLYRYAGGRRSGIKEGSATIASGQWQELGFELTGDRLRGSLNGKVVLEATDASYRAGRVGLWTKADSVTCFDDVAVRPVG